MSRYLGFNDILVLKNLPGSVTIRLKIPVLPKILINPPALFDRVCYRRRDKGFKECALDLKNILRKVHCFISLFELSFSDYFMLSKFYANYFAIRYERCHSSFIHITATFDTGI